MKKLQDRIINLEERRRIRAARAATSNITIAEAEAAYRKIILGVGASPATGPRLPDDAHDATRAYCSIIQGRRSINS